MNPKKKIKVTKNICHSKRRISKITKISMVKNGVKDLTNRIVNKKFRKIKMIKHKKNNKSIKDILMNGDKRFNKILFLLNQYHLSF
jgi:hypothetical protein